jgi:hypothetical protein
MMMIKRSPSAFFLCLCAALASVLFLGGCSGGKGPTVKGTVTMDGNPLDHAELAFVPEDSKGQVAADIVRTNEKGEFEVKPSSKKRGLKPGKYYVKISKWVDKKTNQVPVLDPEAGMDVEQLKTAGMLKNVVPERYSSTDNLAGLLTIEVTADGKDDVKLDVKGK